MQSYTSKDDSRRPTEHRRYKFLFLLLEDILFFSVTQNSLGLTWIGKKQSK